MDTATKASLIQEGGKLLSDGIRLMMSKPKIVAARCEEPPAKSPEPKIVAATQSQPLKKNLPTSEETTHELKRRLSKELYRAELDLASGLRIAGKPCDCLTNKHTLGLEATAEELISQDPGNNTYKQIISWIGANQHKLTVEAIESGKYAAEYPKMAQDFKIFRKNVLGTSADAPRPQPAPTMTLEEAKKIAAHQAEVEVERRWHSAEKK